MYVLSAAKWLHISRDQYLVSFIFCPLLEKTPCGNYWILVIMYHSVCGCVRVHYSMCVHVHVHSYACTCIKMEFSAIYIYDGTQGTFMVEAVW